jgi:hypothetical protein
VYCPGGRRHRGGVNVAQATVKERGNLKVDVKGVRTSGKHPRGESTEAVARGGLGRSSDEALVMRVERRA